MYARFSLNLPSAHLTIKVDDLVNSHVLGVMG